MQLWSGALGQKKKRGLFFTVKGPRNERMAGGWGGGVRSLFGPWFSCWSFNQVSNRTVLGQTPVEGFGSRVFTEKREIQREDLRGGGGRATLWKGYQYKKEPLARSEFCGAIRDHQTHGVITGPTPPTKLRKFSCSPQLSGVLSGAV